MRNRYIVVFTLLMWIVGCNSEPSSKQLALDALSRKQGDIGYASMSGNLYDFALDVRNFKECEIYKNVKPEDKDVDCELEKTVKMYECEVIKYVDEHPRVFGDSRKVLRFISESTDPKIKVWLEKKRSMLMLDAKQRDESDIGAERRRVASGWSDIMKSQMGHSDFIAYTSGKHDTTLIVMDSLMTPNVAVTVFRSESSGWAAYGFKQVVFKNQYGRVFRSFGL